jgi:hypothetical protein
MSREYLLEWRKAFKGPIHYEKGDLVWSKVRSKVVDRMEFFILEIQKNHPEFPRLNEEFKDVHDNDWNGEYLVPCSYVRFSDREEELRPARELFLGENNND